MKTSAGLKFNNYIGSIHIRNMLRNTILEPEIKNININGQTRGCSGFILNPETGKYCYITTEPFFDYGEGNGLFGNPRNAVMMRTAKSNRDYTGGRNQWLPVEDIVETAMRLTS